MADPGRAWRPPVTVIVPTYNRAVLLEQAIESVLAQDYDDLELLVLDDGSTDSTPAILRHFAARHPRRRFRWERHENMGQARTLNRGFELARGEVLGYLSSDDLLLPGAVAKLVAALAEPGVVLAYPAYQVIDERGDVLETMTPIEYSTAEALRLHNCIVHVGALYKRSVVEQVGGWDPSFVNVADLDWCLRASATGRFVRVAEPLACWRRHPDSANFAPGLRAAREQPALLDKFYSQPDLPDELLAVRDEAYRNAHFVAAQMMGGFNRRGSRFFAYDRLARRVASEGAERDAEMILRLRVRAAELEERQEDLQRILAQHRERIRRLETTLAESSRGRLKRIARTVVPAPLRPRLRALYERARR